MVDRDAKPVGMSQTPVFKTEVFKITVFQTAVAWISLCVVLALLLFFVVLPYSQLLKSLVSENQGVREQLVQLDTRLQGMREQRNKQYKAYQALPVIPHVGQKYAEDERRASLAALNTALAEKDCGVTHQSTNNEFYQGLGIIRSTITMRGLWRNCTPALFSASAVVKGHVKQFMVHAEAGDINRIQLILESYYRLDNMEGVNSRDEARQSREGG